MVVQFQRLDINWYGFNKTRNAPPTVAKGSFGSAAPIRGGQFASQ
jgi:hypothetical protein